MCAYVLLSIGTATVDDNICKSYLNKADESKDGFVDGKCIKSHSRWASI